MNALTMEGRRDANGIRMIDGTRKRKRKPGSDLCGKHGKFERREVEAS